MTEAEQPHLIVRAAGHLCALPIPLVIEIMRPAGVTRGSGDPACLYGFAMVRGRSVAVFDLAILLGLGQHDATAESARLVSVNVGPEPAAMLVDEVLGLRRLDPETCTRIDPPAEDMEEKCRFDRQFAPLMEAARLVPSEMAAIPGHQQVVHA